MNGYNFRSRLLATSFFAGAAFCLGGASAQGQETEDPAVEMVDEAGDDVARQQTVVVTGSRIARPEFASSFATNVLDTEEIDRKGYINIGDALNDIPSFGTGIDPQGDQGDNIGVQFVDLFDLGSQRTLALVNGRRVVSQNVAGLGGQVDLSTLPVGIVERVDVVQVGGAAIYGSDAVAGTVNVILKDDFEGMEYQGQMGVSERGDFESEDVQFTIGANTPDGRGNVVVAFEYSDTESLRQDDRPETFVGDPFFAEVGPGSDRFQDVDADGDGEPDTVFQLFQGQGGQNVQLFTNGGIASPGATVLPSIGLGAVDGDFLAFGPDGNLNTIQPGTSIPNTSLFFAEGGFSNPFFSAVDQIVSPVERFTSASTFHYDITDNITFFGDAQFANTKSVEIAEQGGFQTFAFDGFSQPLTFSTDNPFLTDQARSRLEGAGLDSFVLSRFMNDIIDSQNLSESQMWRISGGFEGDFEVVGREFNWDFAAIAGQFSNTLQGTGINDRRFLLALDAVELTADDVAAIEAAGNGSIGQAGDIVCDVTRQFAQADPAGQQDILNDIGLFDTDLGIGDDPTLAPDVLGCAPLNLFGVNNASQAALDYVVNQTIQDNDIDQAIYTANFGGQVVELPAGWASFNVGWEARRESANFQPGGFTQTGSGRGSATPRTGGSFTTDEYYTEAYIPVLSPDMAIPFAENLFVEASYRFIDNSLAGSDSVWSVGGQFSPIEDITFRGNRTRAVRAPSLVELFQPRVTAFEFADDPCDQRFIEDGPNRVDNCLAAGIDIDSDGDGTFDFISDVVNATASGTTGGNDNLDNEVSDAFTVGMIVQPRYVPNLSIDFSYSEFEVEDLINAFTLENLMEVCFDADPGAFPVPECDQFTRDGAGQITSFSSGRVNADSLTAKFYELSVDYNFDVAEALTYFGRETAGDWGQIALGTNVSHTNEREEVEAGVVIDPTVGGFFDPKFQGISDVVYTRGPLQAFWRINWQDNSRIDPAQLDVFGLNGEVIETTDKRLIHDAMVSYDVGTLLPNYGNPLEIQLNVDNVFDRTATVEDIGAVALAANDFGFDEQIGRRFLVTIRGSF